MNPDQLRCQPAKPDEKCFNCKRRVVETRMYVNAKNSKDKACIYIPISLQVKT